MSIPLLKYFQRAKRPIPNNPYLNIGGLVPPNWNQINFLQAYGEIGWLHAVVFRIALGCSEVEWTLFDTTNQDKPKQIFKHPVLNLLHQVNPFQTSNEFIALDTIYNELIGESFWALNFNALGEPAEIILPYPQRMSVIPDKSFPFVRGYVYGSGADAIPFDVNEIIHFKYPNPLNQYHGLAPARAIGVNLDAEQNADKWVNQFFYNSARPDGVIQFDYNLSDEQFDKLKKQWSERFKGVSKAHQVALLEGGGKYIQIQNTIKDMDFPNLKQKNRDVILGVFGMPQSVMGISENVNKANAEAGDYQYTRNLIRPRLTWKKAKLQEQLIPKFRHSENLELGFKEVVPETTEQKITSAESGMRAGYLTINEARKMQGYDSLPNGDVLLVPLNLIPTPISGSRHQVQTTPPAGEELVEESYKGGEGSGNFGHEGRPGEVGGSGEGGGGGSNPKPSGGEWQQSLSSDEDNSLKSWKGGHCSDIRRAQKEGKGEYLKEANNIETALSKASPYDGVVYRGAQLTQEKYEMLSKADSFELKALSSASTERSVAWDFGTSGFPEHAAVYRITNKTGIDISVYPSMFGEENEVLLRKGAKFKIDKVVKYDLPSSFGTTRMLNIFATEK